MKELRVPKAYVSNPSDVGISQIDHIPLEGDYAGVLPTERIPATDSRSYVLQALMAHQLTWIQTKLGIDVSDRLEGTDRYSMRERVMQHFNSRVYLCTNDVWKSVRTQLGEKVTNVGVTHIPSGTSIVNFDEDQDWLGIGGHELLHILGGKSLLLKRSLQDHGEVLLFRNAYAGYEHPILDTHFLSEVVTEVLNLHILHDFRDKKTDYKTLSLETAGRYEPGVVLFLHLVAEAANRLQVDRKRILNQVYRGYVTSDYTGLRFIADAFGSEGFMKFIQDFNQNYFSSGGTKSYDAFMNRFSIENTSFYRNIESTNYKSYTSSFFSEGAISN